MATNTRRRRAPILIVVALAALLTLPAVSAQIGSSVRIGGGPEQPKADASIDVDTSLPGGTDTLPTKGIAPIVAEATGTDETRHGEAFRLHTRINAGTVSSLVSQSLEVPEVRKLISSQAVIEVKVDTTSYRVDVHDGAVTGVTPASQVAGADYVIRAGTDAARSLANAPDPAYTAITLLKGQYITVEAAKLTHQAALKAFFSGVLDSRLDIRSGLQEVTIDGAPTAAEKATLDAGLRIVRHDGNLYAANEFGGIVAALHNGNRALGNPPAELGIQLSGAAGGAAMPSTQLAGLPGVGTAPLLHILQGGSPDAASLGLEATHIQQLTQAGAPNAFVAGLGAGSLARAALAEADR